MSKERDKNKQPFLKTFFDNNEIYAEKEINGYWLVQWQNKDKWFVSIYTPEKMANYKLQSKLF